MTSVDVQRSVVDGGVGTSPRRPDGTLKVSGEFAFSSDLWADDMLWGATVRTPHPSRPDPLGRHLAPRSPCPASTRC